MKEITINTPEVTDLTDNVAGLATFGFSYLKNAVDGVCKSVGTGFKQAKVDAEHTKDVRSTSRAIKKEVQAVYEMAVLDRIAEMRKAKGESNA